MKTINRLLILTIILNFLIPVGAGHGIGFLGLIEIMGLSQLVHGDAIFSFTGDYDNRLFTAATIAIAGQIILTVAYFSKQQNRKFKIIYFGIFILFFSYFTLTIELFEANLDNFSFWAGTPFSVLAILLLVKTVKNHRLALQEDYIK